MKTDVAITAQTTINELLQAYPDTLATLHALKVHTCCGGGLPLAEAGAKAGVDESVLMENVYAAIAADASH